MNMFDQGQMIFFQIHSRLNSKAGINEVSQFLKIGFGCTSGGVNSAIFSLLRHLADLSGLCGFFVSQT